MSEEKKYKENRTGRKDEKTWGNMDIDVNWLYYEITQDQEKRLDIDNDESILRDNILENNKWERNYWKSVTELQKDSMETP